MPIAHLVNMQELLDYLKRNKIESLYHATYQLALDSILEYGLGANPPEKINAWEGLSKPYVYLASTEGMAESYAEAADNPNLPEEWLYEIVVLEIKVSDLDLSLLDFDDNNQMEEPDRTFKYKGIIPASNLLVKK
jgi:hypothetical protein